MMMIAVVMIAIGWFWSSTCGWYCDDGGDGDDDGDDDCDDDCDDGGCDAIMMVIVRVSGCPLNVEAVVR